jgi:hypothetical protein
VMWMMRNGRKVDSVTQMTVALSAREISFFAMDSGFKNNIFFCDVCGIQWNTVIIVLCEVSVLTMPLLETCVIICQMFRPSQTRRIHQRGVQYSSMEYQWYIASCAFQKSRRILSQHWCKHGKVVLNVNSCPYETCINN